MKDRLFSLKEYTGTAYKRINSYLVTGKESWHDEKALHEGIQRVFNSPAGSYEHYEDMHTYAGVHPNRTPKVMNVGDRVHFPAYTSTSIKPDIARNFAADQDNGGGDRHFVHFHIPKGTPGWLYLDGSGPDHTKNEGEGEVLLNAGTKGTYLGTEIHEVGTKRYHIHSVVVHHPKDDAQPDLFG